MIDLLQEWRHQYYLKYRIYDRMLEHEKKETIKLIEKFETILG